jgi:sigma-B regulation protein RsbU (phosphoserine phosphatase)
MTSSRQEILIVDDTPANLKLLSQILAANGYNVRIAVNGAQALTSIEIALPDLILLDIKMPGLNGFEVCQRLKANPSTRDIPVIFISALNDLQDKLDGFHAGGLDYISKPFQIEEVLARVNAHLFVRKAQQILESNNQRMQRELNLAGHLQSNFIPQKLPPFPGWEFSASLKPALETSGDFYDLLELPNGNIALFIADVVDKGVSAALLMVLTWSLMRERILSAPDLPQQVLADVNQRMLAILTDLEFVTVFLGILDPHTGQLTYANAGHNPPLVFQAGGADILRLGRTGLALGIDESAVWTMDQVLLSPGDVLLLYTDGVPEACNPDGEFVGLERLIQCVNPLIQYTAKGIKTTIEAELDQFLSGQPPQDDLTLMVVKRITSQ